MKFGVREISDVVFKATQATKIGGQVFRMGEPVLYIDSAKTSTIEGSATTVYAQGGCGNSRLITWEGEKNLTFTVEDALLSEVGFAILSGAGLFQKLGTAQAPAMVHRMEKYTIDADGKLIIPAIVFDKAPIYIMSIGYGSLSGKVPYLNLTVDNDKSIFTFDEKYADKTVFVDYYVAKQGVVTELQIDAENFAGYYYVEAMTSFRRESDGKDLKVTLTFPKVKIQSNFTFNMSPTGDPSTFSFVMDAMPGYTMFERTKKVLLAMQIINEVIGENSQKAVTAGNADVNILKNDSLSDETSAEYFEFKEVNSETGIEIEGGNN